jgi:uncharacterized GH25 family protein
MLRKLCLAAALFALSASAAPAHYNMLLPSKNSVKKGEQVTFTYQWGHPFEHQLFDAPGPESLMVYAPSGKQTNLLKSLEKVSLDAGEGKKATAYRFAFTPPERGDYVFVLQTPAIWMEEDGEFLQDTVKVVLHVQAQKGWDDLHLDVMELEHEPLTRPYGLLPGAVFQTRIFGPAHLVGSDGNEKWIPNPNGVRNLLVEVERYNAVAPRDLPADEFITRVVKTDPNGVATCNLPEAGWWALTARESPEREQKERDGKKYKVFRRSTLWVYVNEKPVK